MNSSIITSSFIRSSMLAGALSTVHAQSPPLFELPAPTGQSPIGTTRWAVAAARPVLVTAWYPAAAPRSGPPAPYLREGIVEAQTFSRLFFKGQVSGFDGLIGVRTHSAEDAAPAASPARLPLLLFSHGYAGIPSSYTALLEDLASHGYAVLSIVHPYEATGATLEDGRTVSMLDEAGSIRQEIRDVLGEWAKEDETMAAVTKTADEEEQRRLLRAYLASIPNTTRLVQRWVADTKAVLDGLAALPGETPAGRLAARVDAQRVGVFGHSLGGVVAGEFCIDNRWCGAAANLDGIPQYGSMIDTALGRPFMMVYAVRPGRLGASDPIYRRAARPYVRADVADTLHLDFSDMVFWTPLRARKALGAIDPARATAMTRRLVREFFDESLRGREAPLLSGRETMSGVTVRRAG